MKKFALKTAQIYDDNQNLISANKLDWKVDETKTFNDYDAANIARISAQSTNNKLYIGITAINDKE